MAMASYNVFFFFTGELIRTYAAMTLTLETSLEIRGELKSLPPKAHAPLDRELHADYFTVIGAAVGDKEAITNKVQEVSLESWPSVGPVHSTDRRD